MSGRRSPRVVPRLHWLALLAAAVVFATLLVVFGFTHRPPGEDGVTSGSGQGGVPQAVLSGGPVLNGSRPRQPGAPVARRTIALTFDDGPSSYTAGVLRVLERYHVPATFFVIGANIAGRSGLLRRMVADGDEIGVHTFTHPDLGSVGPSRERLELSLTQLAIASATGDVTDLMRLPYSSTISSITTSQWRATADAPGYRVVFATRDTEDWQRPGVARIVSRATPRDGAGAVVMLHDGGGNRTQTVRALSVLIPRLQRMGYRFETVSAAIGAPSPWTAASAWQRWRGTTLLAALVAARWVVDSLQFLFLIAGGLAVLRTVLLVLLARRHSRAARRLPAIELARCGVSVVVPAYNEQAGIERCVRSLAASDWPELDIVVVDDGSTDGTAGVVRRLGLPNVRVITQPNAGKPSALTTGIRAARHDVLVLVDGDTVFERESVAKLVRPLADPKVGAVSGNTKVGNRAGLIGRWQHVEYVIGFNLDRRMYDVLQCMPTVPGAIGAFRREVLETVGGVSHDTLAEDTDLTMAICRAGWRVVFAPDALAWTEAPASLAALWRQRYRWCYGTMQAMWKHRHAVVERGAAGRLGRRGLPYLLLFQVLLPLLAPVVDIATVTGFLSGRGTALLIAFVVFLLIQLVSAAYAFALDNERNRTLWVLPLQQFVYRQLMYLVVFQSIASAVYGSRLRWHKLDRTGDLSSAPVAG